MFLYLVHQNLSLKNTKKNIFLNRCYAISWRVIRKINKEIIHLVLPFITNSNSSNSVELIRLGSDYGGWHIPTKLLNNNSICYCAGIGVDATFDFELLEHYKCNVFSFDPTPQAIKYMAHAKYNKSLLTFLQIGVWNKNTTQRFYAPSNPKHTSHSVYDLHGTNNYIEVECKTLSSIMNDLGHNQIDLLKLDIEGAWRQVLSDAVENNIKIKILCVELDSPVSLIMVLKLIKEMKHLKLSLIHVEKDNYLFLNENILIN